MSFALKDKTCIAKMFYGRSYLTMMRLACLLPKELGGLHDEKNFTKSPCTVAPILHML